jgi:hypothetical protein
MDMEQELFFTIVEREQEFPSGRPAMETCDAVARIETQEMRRRCAHDPDN